MAWSYLVGFLIRSNPKWKTPMVQHFDEYGGGNARVMAGPGTGKTTAITRLVRRLVNAEGVSADRILLLTFGRATAADIRDRLKKLDPPIKRMPVVSTLHGFCYRELRIHTGSAFLGPHTIDEWEERHLLCEDLGAAVGVSGAKAHEHLDKYDAAWAQLTEPPTLAEVAHFEGEVERLRGVFGFALLGEPVNKFKRFLDGDPTYTPALDYLLVDEYQDLNPCDLEVIRKLTARSGATTVVVGDDDQCIYETIRYADPDGLGRFPEVATYQGCGEYELDVCWRVPARILQPALRLIQHSPARVSKDITSNEDGGDVWALSFASPEAQVDAVVQIVQRNLAGGVPAGEILMLVPRRRFAHSYAEALAEAGIPVVNEAAPNKALREPRVRGVIYALRLLADPEDAVAMRGWFKCYGGVGPRTSLALADLTDDKTSYNEVSRGSELARVAKAIEALNELQNQLATRKGLEAELARIASDIDLNEETREIIEQFATRAWGDELGPDDERGEAPAEKAKTDVIELEQDRVRVLTLRKAKGLGAETVIVTDLEEAVIPGDSDRDEQRRIFYVAMTRARRRLYLTHVAAARFDSASYAGTGARQQGQYRPRSRFLDEAGLESK